MFLFVAKGLARRLKWSALMSRAPLLPRFLGAPGTPGPRGASRPGIRRDHSNRRPGYPKAVWPDWPPIARLEKLDISVWGLSAPLCSDARFPVGHSLAGLASGRESFN
jgi:hypothetical protein